MMALPGQTFKRVVVLLLDCGRSMQQPFHSIPGGHAAAAAVPSMTLLEQRSSGEQVAKERKGAYASTLADTTSKAAVGALADAEAAAAVAAAAAATSPLDLMETCVLRYLENLAVASARVDVCIIAYGSPDTRNHLASDGERSEGYLHIEELREPLPISWQARDVVAQHMQHVKDRKIPSRSDWIDAVVVAADVVERTYGAAKIVQHEVFFLLFSDFTSPPASEEDLVPVQEHLKKLDIQLIAILASSADARLPPVLLPGGEGLQQRPSVQKNCELYPQYQQQHTEQKQQQEQELQQECVRQEVFSEHRGLMPLWKCAAAVVPWRSFCDSTALRFPSLLRSRRLTTKCRVPLKISSSFSLPVFVFLQTKRESLPPLKKRVFFRSSSSRRRPAAARAAAAADGEKRRRSDSAAEDVEGDGEESAAANTAARLKRRREGDTATATATATEKTDNIQETAEGDSGWRDVRVHRFYYRAHDPDRRPVHFVSDNMKNKMFASLSPRQRAGEENTEDDDGEAAVATAGAVSKTETEAKTVAQQQQQQKLLGYRFGRQLVVISPLEQQALKQLRRPAAIEVLGVVQQTKIKRWWLTGNTEYVTSGLNCLSALLALRALVLALQRLHAALICSFTWREGQPARPAVLLPHTYYISAAAAGAQNAACASLCSTATSGHPPSSPAAAASNTEEENKEQRRCYGFHLVYLPFAEDMQTLRLPSLRPVSPAQLHAVGALVTQLTFPSPVTAAAAAEATPAETVAPASLSQDAECPRGKTSTTAAGAAAGAAERLQHMDRQEPQQQQWAATKGWGSGAAMKATVSADSCAAVLFDQRETSNSNSGKRGSINSSMYASLPNPAVEIWNRYHGVVSPSPPCSSSLYSTFLPPSISLLSSLQEYLDPTCIPSPALERLYALLAYRRRCPLAPATVSHSLSSKSGGYSSGDSRSSSSKMMMQASSSSLQQQRLFCLLWPPEYSSTTHSFRAAHAASSTPETLFNWSVCTPQHQGGEEEDGSSEEGTATAVRKLKNERNIKGSKVDSATMRPQEAAKDLLFTAFPLGTSAAAQQSLRERRTAGKQQLWEDVQHKQRRLQGSVRRLRFEDVKLPPELQKGHEKAARDTAAAEGSIGEEKAAAGEEKEGEEAAERAAEAEARKERIALLEKKLHVKSINPVGDFRRMLEVKEVDLTEKAIEEMIAVIHRFLEAAQRRDAGNSENAAAAAAEDIGKQQLLGKAFACVTALREGCRRELEGTRFNAFLRSIKATAVSVQKKQCDAANSLQMNKEEEEARHADKGTPERTAAAAAQQKEEEKLTPASTSAITTFYMWLKDAKVALITTAEDPRAGVKPEEALSIYSDASTAVEEQQQPTQVKTPPEISTDVQELLDLIE